MTRLRGFNVKDNVITIRMTRRVADRVRRVATKNELTMAEWLRLAAVEKLNRDDRGGAGGAVGTGGAALSQEASHGA
jgi:hypothetical protein